MLCVLFVEEKMRKKHFRKPVIFTLILLLIFSVTGCGRVDNTIAEPDEITAEYLYGEYAEQLVRDGAEVALGTVALEPSDNGSFTITTNRMVIVESDITDEGYYIADSNVAKTVPLDPDVRITYFQDEKSEASVVTLDEFKDIVSDENYDPLEEGNEELYDVYIINGTAVMILAKELPSAE